MPQLRWPCSRSALDFSEVVLSQVSLLVGTKIESKHRMMITQSSATSNTSPLHQLS